MVVVEGDGLERRVFVIYEEIFIFFMVFFWDRFFNWIYCVCVVIFDLELG